MTKIKLTTSLLFLAVLFGGCSFIGNTFQYKRKTKDFVESLLHENYDKSISLMDTAGRNVNTGAIKSSLVNLHNIIKNNFGDKLDYTFESATKRFSTTDSNNTPAGETEVEIQISNKTDFGVVKMLYNDKTLKINSFDVLSIKEPIPGMVGFWIFGLITLCVLAFNIYMIVRVKRSSLKKKWLQYLFIVFLNAPTITYSLVNGLSLSIFEIQFMFGISCSFMGYLNSIFAFGIPVGSLYVLSKLRKATKETTDTELPGQDERIKDDSKSPTSSEPEKGVD